MVLGGSTVSKWLPSTGWPQSCQSTSYHPTICTIYILLNTHTPSIPQLQQDAVTTNGTNTVNGKVSWYRSEYHWKAIDWSGIETIWIWNCHLYWKRGQYDPANFHQQGTQYNFANWLRTSLLILSRRGPTNPNILPVGVRLVSVFTRIPRLTNM